ncbi:MAG: prepilin peptidase, partial [Eubacterium sp.]|nr:prepilin peptidase [Eubacterium sp.]
RSHCAVCGHPLKAADLIPIVSYLVLKGKCRYCGDKISPRYMLSELLLAGLYLVMILRFGLTFEALRAIVLVSVLFTLSLVDLEIYEIPNGFILFGIIWWAVCLPLMGEPIPDQLVKGLIGGGVIAGAVLLVSLIFDKLLGKESMGGGDIKLFFMTGLYLGIGVSLFNLILSCILGLVFVAVLKSKKIPFGPAISAGTVISLLVGGGFMNWYTGLLGIT